MLFFPSKVPSMRPKEGPACVRLWESQSVLGRMSACPVLSSRGDLVLKPDLKFFPN